MKIDIFYDVTLRDGSHANGHSFTKDFCLKYITQAYKSGIRYIELGHGNGIGGSSLHIGELLEKDLFNIIEKAKLEFPDLKFGVHVIPGLAKFDSVKSAVDQGVSILRVASHCSEADTTETFIEYGANLGCEVWGLLMMSHMIKPDHLAREAEKMELYGASRIVFLDSAGALTPKKVKEITNEIISLINIPLGFHAHNNLHAAVANSLAAINQGCTSIDFASRGYGAGAGNLSSEAFISILEKDGYKSNLKLNELIKLSSLIESEFEKTLPNVDSLSVATGFKGLFSGFKKRIIEASHTFNVDTVELIEKLGDLQVIAGQEDQIIETASELNNNKNKTL